MIRRTQYECELVSSPRLRRNSLRVSAVSVGLGCQDEMIMKYECELVSSPRLRRNSLRVSRSGFVGVGCHDEMK